MIELLTALCLSAVAVWWWRGCAPIRWRLTTGPTLPTIAITEIAEPDRVPGCFCEIIFAEPPRLFEADEEAMRLMKPRPIAPPVPPRVNLPIVRIPTEWRLPGSRPPPEPDWRKVLVAP
jgi:hypothetical protein